MNQLWPPRDPDGRLPSAALFCLIVGLTGLVVWAALTTRSSTDRALEADAMRRGYEQARDAFTAENALRRRAFADAGADLARGLPSLDAAFDRGLRAVRASAGERDRLVAVRIEAEHDRYASALQRLLELVREGRESRARRFESESLEPLTRRLGRRIEVADDALRAVPTNRLAGLRSREKLVLEVAVIAGVAGLLLVCLIASALRVQRRRAGEARQRELERLRRAAITDALTGLRNRRAFQEDLERELELSSGPLALAMFDLDGLKALNDRLGHKAGDDRLRELSQALRDAIGSYDSVYRIGGDEFAMVLPLGAWETFGVVQELQLKLSGAGSGEGTTVTAGVAEASPGSSRDTLIQQADTALMEAKRSHRQALMYSREVEEHARAAGAAPLGRSSKTLATALARAVDAKDSWTRSHCETVSSICVMIAEELGLDARRVAKLRLAGLLHDVGKIGIPDSILQKPGPLSDEEFERMKCHSRLGSDIVSAAELYDEARWILHHHERPDGYGYPDGLAGDEIPLESRIILVADAFEAITSDRPYRSGRPEAEALGELESDAGSQFDPECVAALRRALGRGQTLHALAPPAGVLTPA